MVPTNPIGAAAMAGAKGTLMTNAVLASNSFVLFNISNSSFASCDVFVCNRSKPRHPASRGLKRKERSASERQSCLKAVQDRGRSPMTR